MNPKEHSELPPEIEAELQEIENLIAERQASTRAAINAHSQAGRIWRAIRLRKPQKLCCVRKKIWRALEKISMRLPAC
jgi:hypothetical protein